MRKIILGVVLMMTSILTAQSNYPEIDKLIDAGDFVLAEKMIDNILIENEVSATDKLMLQFQKERMNRIRLDFKKTAVDILDYVRKYYPDADQDDLERWENDGSLEFKLIDGKKFYFNRAHTNLFRINKEAKERKIKVDGESIDKLDQFLSDFLPKVISKVKENGSNIVDKKKFILNYELSVDADVIPPGEIIRCWLPFPRNGHERQTNIKLLSVNSDEYIVASNDHLQRTLYLEKETVAGKPTIFKMSLEYNAYSEWYDIEPDKVKEYDTNSELYNKYTSERIPHITFTEKIKKVSKEIVGDETNPFLKAKKIFTWISNNIPWAGAREYSTIENISDYCLTNMHGDCGIKTLLFITLCRYNGIPAKWQSGWMLHPPELNLHDWGEFYLEGYGWVPVDQSFGIQYYSDDEEVRYFYLGGIDSYRLISNDDFSKPLYPAKIYPRSETVDFQRGEVEWRGGNIYFDKWDYHMDVEYID